MFYVNAIVQSLLQPARQQLQTKEEFDKGQETPPSPSKRAASKKKRK